MDFETIEFEKNREIATIWIKDLGVFVELQFHKFLTPEKFTIFVFTIFFSNLIGFEIPSFTCAKINNEIDFCKKFKNPIRIR